MKMYVRRSRTWLLAASLAIPSIVRAQASSLSENFSDITTLAGAGWVRQNNSSAIGSTGWFQGNNTVFPAYDGAPSHYIAANFNNVSGLGTISNWLVTPTLTLTNGATFSFFTRTVSQPANFPDRLELRLSTAGASQNVGALATEVGDFTTLVLGVNSTLSPEGYPSEWTQYTATLFGLSGSTTGRFAFRYFVPNGGELGANSNYIGIDAVSYSSSVVPEPASLALVGAGLCALVCVQRRRRA